MSQHVVTVVALLAVITSHAVFTVQAEAQCVPEGELCHFSAPKNAMTLTVHRDKPSHLSFEFSCEHGQSITFVGMQTRSVAGIITNDPMRVVEEETVLTQDGDGCVKVRCDFLITDVDPALLPAEEIVFKFEGASRQWALPVQLKAAGAHVEKCPLADCVLVPTSMALHADRSNQAFTVHTLRCPSSLAITRRHVSTHGAATVREGPESAEFDGACVLHTFAYRVEGAGPTALAVAAQIKSTYTWISGHVDVTETVDAHGIVPSTSDCASCQLSLTALKDSTGALAALDAICALTAPLHVVSYALWTVPSAGSQNAIALDLTGDLRMQTVLDAVSTEGSTCTRTRFVFRADTQSQTCNLTVRVQLPNDASKGVATLHVLLQPQTVGANRDDLASGSTTGSSSAVGLILTIVGAALGVVALAAVIAAIIRVRNARRKRAAAMYGTKPNGIPYATPLLGHQYMAFDDV